MKTFFIKIVSSQLPTFWYSKKIGEKFEVVGACKTNEKVNNFIVKKGNDCETYMVDWHDCELTDKSLIIY